uniref:non-specific serine/threonine protein kinase n=1 Tax=Xiphophorus couchianus TaxID=32473 RepID=A0A3B5L0Q4_9TELE
MCTCVCVGVAEGCSGSHFSSDGTPQPSRSHLRDFYSDIRPVDASLCIFLFKEFENVDCDEYHADMSTLASTVSQGTPDVYVLPLTEVSLPTTKQPARSAQLLKSSELTRHSLLYLKEIGHGWFGKVLLGEVNTGLNTTQVVVKELKVSASVQDQMHFLEEAQPYRSLPNTALQWSNLVACRCIIFLCCVQGDVKGYLRSCRSNEAITPEPLILQRMACDIASGLLHLHKHNFTHSDLALRNCLLTADISVKIGDYGLAHTKYKDDFYVTSDQTYVPLRWIAPELVDEVHGNLLLADQTQQSNIWSLGVTIWELFELGNQPYRHYSDRQVLTYAVREQQLRLPKPLLKVPLAERWYEVMQFCWLQPDQRPNAEEVHLLLSYLCAKGASEAEEDFERRWNSLRPNAGFNGHHTASTISRDQPSLTSSSFPLLEQFSSGDGYHSESGDDILTVTETSHGLNFEYKWEQARAESSYISQESSNYQGSSGSFLTAISLTMEPLLGQRHTCNTWPSKHRHSSGGHHRRASHSCRQDSYTDFNYTMPSTDIEDTWPDQHSLAFHSLPKPIDYLEPHQAKDNNACLSLSKHHTMVPSDNCNAYIYLCHEGETPETPSGECCHTHFVDPLTGLLVRNNDYCHSYSHSSYITDKTTDILSSEEMINLSPAPGGPVVSKHTLIKPDDCEEHYINPSSEETALTGKREEVIKENLIMQNPPEPKKEEVTLTMTKNTPPPPDNRHVMVSITDPQLELSHIADSGMDQAGSTVSLIDILDCSDEEEDITDDITDVTSGIFADEGNELNVSPAFKSLQKQVGTPDSMDSMDLPSAAGSCEGLSPASSHPSSSPKAMDSGYDTENNEKETEDHILLPLSDKTPYRDSAYFSDYENEKQSRDEERERQLKEMDHHSDVEKQHVGGKKAEKRKSGEDEELKDGVVNKDLKLDVDHNPKGRAESLPPGTSLTENEEPSDSGRSSPADGEEADEEDADTDDSDDSDEELRSYSAQEEEEESEEECHPVPIVVSDNSEAHKLRSLLKMPSLAAENLEEDHKKKTVSFFDDVTVYLFDQESPTKELVEHGFPLASEGSSSGRKSQERPNISDDSSDGNISEERFEWEDDFPLLPLPTSSTAADSPPPHAVAKAPEPKPAIQLSRFTVSPSNVSRFSITHISDPDMDSAGGWSLRAFRVCIFSV